MSSAPVSPSDTVFLNTNLLNRILKDVVAEPEGGSVMNHLDLRLVNKNFNSTILHQVRQEHKNIIISPLPDSPEDANNNNNEKESLEDVRGFFLNGRQILMSNSFSHFTFLNFRAQIQCRSLKFEGFVEENERVHDAIMFDLMSNQSKLHTFLGSMDICPSGCGACFNVIRSPSTRHAQIHPDLELSEAKHFKSLSITDAFLNDVARRCFSSKNFDATLEESINSKISCDLLEISVPDLIIVEDSEDSDNQEIGILKPSFLPRQLLDRIVVAWKVKKVKISFISGLSRTPQEPWTCSKLTPFHFGQDFHTTTQRLQNQLESVEINLWRSEVFAKSFAYHMVGRVEEDPHGPNGVERNAGFQNLIPNVMRLFPTKKVMVCMPMNLKALVLPRLMQVMEGLKEFTWTDTFNCRRAEFYFRFISDDWKGSLRKVNADSEFQNRPIRLQISRSSQIFDTWLLSELEMLDCANPKLEKLPILIFSDRANLSKIKIQVSKVKAPAQKRPIFNGHVEEPKRIRLE